MSWSNLKRTVAPTALPISLSEITTWLRLDTTDEDALLLQLIQDAVDFIEGPNGIGIALCPQTWELKLPTFPAAIDLPLTPVQSVDSITYLDGDGATQTLDSADYQVDLHNSPALVRPAYGTSWPGTRIQPGSVTVTFTAGYSTVPGDLKRAIALLVGHWYEHRTAVVMESVSELPLGVQHILNKYWVGRVV